MMRRARRQEGFTLIELTVSLAAGLIVALGIVGLSKDATQTFHEEMRSSVAEANLRTAIDRLRADLSRAGYMSTSDVLTDPMIAKPPGQANPINAAVAGLARLSSILLTQGGSQANTPLSLGANGLNPDIIEIGGNMTTTDQYEVSVIQPPGGAGTCQQIFLNPQSPSMYRIIGLGTQATKELNNVFQPTTGGVGQFIVRLTDKTGHSQFLATCPGTPTGFLTPTEPYILVSPQTPVLLGSQTGTVGGLNGFGTGALVNPVQIVHWEIKPASNEQVQYQQGSPLAATPLAPTSVDPLKYDLVRSYVDAQTGLPIPTTEEIVAEYAVDLEFAFSVDTGLSNAQPAITTLAFDNTGNAPWAPNLVTTAPLAGQGPSRIRSVRVRLVTRTAQGDRTLNVAVPNPTPPFMYRYCLVAGGCDPVNAAGALQYARARTVTAEVALPNQARNYY
jgi:prepilin-type N-terminal cleavage/methylation domain-containing protein